MASTRKALLKEINLWKKRFTDSRKVLNSAYQDVSKDAKKAYKVVTK